MISHPDLRWKHCDIKSTNLLANVLANRGRPLAGLILKRSWSTPKGWSTEATHHRCSGYAGPSRGHS